MTHDDRMTMIMDSLDINEFDRRRFFNLITELRDLMDFDFVAPTEIAEMVKTLSEKTQKNMLAINTITLDQITEYLGWMNQVHYFFAEKQAEAESKSIQLKEAVKMQEAGVVFALAKFGRTLADRIRKAVTNQDKEAIGRMVTVQQAQSELAWYHVSLLMKNLMRNMNMQHQTLTLRYNKLYMEYRIEKERQARGGA